MLKIIAIFIFTLLVQNSSAFAQKADERVYEKRFAECYKEFRTGYFTPKAVSYDLRITPSVYRDIEDKLGRPPKIHQQEWFAEKVCGAETETVKSYDLLIFRLFKISGIDIPVLKKIVPAPVKRPSSYDFFKQSVPAIYSRLERSEKTDRQFADVWNTHKSTMEDTRKKLVSELPEVFGLTSYEIKQIFPRIRYDKRKWKNNR